MGFKQIIKEYWIGVIVVIIWFVLRGKLGTKVFDTADYYLMCIVIAWLGYKSFVDYLKYHTPQIVTEGHHFSNYTGGFEVGDWIIFRCGDAFGWGFAIEGDDATLVVPRYLVSSIGTNYVCNARTEKWDFEDLHLEIQGMIDTHALSKENVFVGIAPSYYERSNPDILDDIKLLKDQNDLITRKQRMFKGDISQVEETASHAARIGDRLTGQKGFISKIFKSEQAPSQEEKGVSK